MQECLEKKAIKKKKNHPEAYFFEIMSSREHSLEKLPLMLLFHSFYLSEDRVSLRSPAWPGSCYLSGRPGWPPTHS